MLRNEGLIFPYAIKLKENGVIERFPAAEVSFLPRDGEKPSLFFIIDSGATISALPKSDAEFFGIQPENGIPLSISGISGEVINGWKHKITVYLGNKRIQLSVVFLDNEFIPRILGREDVFDCFTIVFEQEKQRTGFLEKQSSSARNIQKILNKLQR